PRCERMNRMEPPARCGQEVPPRHRSCAIGDRTDPSAPRRLFPPDSPQTAEGNQTLHVVLRADRTATAARSTPDCFSDTSSQSIESSRPICPRENCRVLPTNSTALQLHLLRLAAPSGTR